MDECEKWDTKGLYKKARAGKGFTGIDQPYEAPDNPNVMVKTVKKSVPECAGDAAGGDLAQAAGGGDKRAVPRPGRLWRKRGPRQRRCPGFRWVRWICRTQT